jgi:hypothetical protein
MKYRKRQRVNIFGLKKAVHYNGMDGMIVSLPSSPSSPANERYGVQVLDKLQKKKAILVRPENLSPLFEDQSKTGNTKKEMVLSSDSTSSFEEGDRVTLHGLATSNYNGKSGIIVRTPEESNNEGRERYGVRIDKSREFCCGTSI